MGKNLNELFTFALDFYRAPLQHQGRLKKCRPYSSSFSRLLEIVSRPHATEDLNAVSSALQKSPETLVSAALFLIRQLLFTEKGSHYEVLGLQKTASLQDIKKRYRTLISLFHPDKNPEGEEWSQLYAPDLNEAYNVLKNESRRNSYDLTLSDGPRSHDSNSPRQRSANAPRSARAARPYSPTSGPPASPPLNQARRPRTQPSASASFEAAPSATLWQQHPHVLAWGSAVAILVLIIVVVSLRSPDYDLDMSSSQPSDVDLYQQPSTPVREENSNLNGTGDALRFALKQSATSNTPPALPESTYSQPSDTLSALSQASLTQEQPGQRDRDYETAAATLDVSAVVNQYMTDEQRAQLSIKNIRPENADVAAELARLEKLRNKKSEDGVDAASIETPAEVPVDVSVKKKMAAIPAVEVQKKAKRIEKTRTQPVAVTAPATVAKPEVVVKPAVVATVAKVITETPVATTEEEPTTDEVEAAFSKEQIEFLLAKYITAYDAGNLNQMTKLFTDSVVTDGGTGIDILKEDYIKLFKKTAERSIEIKGLKQNTAEVDEAYIKFQAYIKVRRHFSNKWKKYSGEMKFTLVSVDEYLKISALSHTVTEEK